MKATLWPKSHVVAKITINPPLPNPKNPKTNPFPRMRFCFHQQSVALTFSDFTLTYGHKVLMNHVVSALMSRFERLKILSEFFEFLKTSKKWWLGPIFVFLLLLSLLIVFTESSALAPFIYSLF